MAGFLKNIRRKLAAGLVTIAPIAITIYIIVFLYNFFEKPTSKFLNKFFDIHIPGLGFIITLILLIFLGFLVTNILGRKLLQLGELILKRIPIANTIYTTAKQITQALAGSTTRAFQKAILFEYPRKDLWTLAFVTGESTDKEGCEYYHLFIPTTPNPTSGFMLIVEKIQTKNTHISVEEAMKIIISGGMLAPPKNEIPPKSSK